MRQETISIYQFAELSEDGKETAREWWRSSTLENGFEWQREWIESIKQGLKSFGAELHDWSIDCLNASQSSVTIINHNDNAGGLTGFRLRTWLLNNYYSNFFERKPYGNYTKNEKTGKWGYKRRSNVLYIETSCPFTGYFGDENFMGIFREFIKKPDGRTLDELLQDATDATLRGLEQDCKYQLTDEYIDEAIQANGYEFNEDGTIY